jgi:hypothetical protein
MTYIHGEESVTELATSKTVLLFDVVAGEILSPWNPNQCAVHHLLDAVGRCLERKNGIAVVDVRPYLPAKNPGEIMRLSVLISISSSWWTTAQSIASFTAKSSALLFDPPSWCFSTSTVPGSSVTTAIILRLEIVRYWLPEHPPSV